MMKRSFAELDTQKKQIAYKVLLASPREIRLQLDINQLLKLAIYSSEEFLCAYHIFVKIVTEHNGNVREWRKRSVIRKIILILILYLPIILLLQERAGVLRKELETLPDISGDSFTEISQFYSLASLYLEKRLGFIKEFLIMDSKLHKNRFWNM